MSNCEFQGISYKNSHHMHAAIAETWLCAGGLNNRADMIEMLSDATDESFADEAIYGWGLAEANDEGEPIMPAFDRADLIKAFADLRGDFDARFPDHDA